MQVVRWPQVLVIHLKRWKVLSMVPFLQEKVRTRIHFETILSENMPQHYHLRGVIVHKGKARGGHYVSYIRPRAPDNFWYFCNDLARPRRVSVQEVLAAEAYMLFYEA